jgi:hypothetical protein
LERKAPLVAGPFFCLIVLPYRLAVDSVRV